jgi:hypothetical protein
MRRDDRGGLAPPDRVRCDEHHDAKAASVQTYRQVLDGITAARRQSSEDRPKAWGIASVTKWTGEAGPAAMPAPFLCASRFPCTGSMARPTGAGRASLSIDEIGRAGASGRGVGRVMRRLALTNAPPRFRRGDQPGLTRDSPLHRKADAASARPALPVSGGCRPRPSASRRCRNRPPGSCRSPDRYWRRCFRPSRHPSGSRRSP